MIIMIFLLLNSNYELNINNHNFFISIEMNFHNDTLFQEINIQNKLDNNIYIIESESVNKLNHLVSKEHVFINIDEINPPHYDLKNNIIMLSKIEKGKNYKIKFNTPLIEKNESFEYNFSLTYLIDVDLEFDIFNPNVYKIHHFDYLKKTKVFKFKRNIKFKDIK